MRHSFEFSHSLYWSDLCSVGTAFFFLKQKISPLQFHIKVSDSPKHLGVFHFLIFTTILANILKKNSCFLWSILLYQASNIQKFQKIARNFWNWHSTVKIKRTFSPIWLKCLEVSFFVHILIAAHFYVSPIFSYRSVD